MVVSCALTSSCCLMVALARVSAMAYISLASLSNFYDLALTSSTAACFLLINSYFMHSQSHFASAFSFSEDFCCFSRETHSRRRRCSSSMSSLS
jgi:hypothetical protein